MCSLCRSELDYRILRRHSRSGDGRSACGLTVHGVYVRVSSPAVAHQLLRLHVPCRILRQLRQQGAIDDHAPLEEEEDPNDRGT